jgi:hypothetical protein
MDRLDIHCKRALLFLYVKSRERCPFTLPSDLQSSKEFQALYNVANSPKNGRNRIRHISAEDLKEFKKNLKNSLDDEEDREDLSVVVKKLRLDMEQARAVVKVSNIRTLNPSVKTELLQQIDFVEESTAEIRRMLSNEDDRGV